MNLQDYKRNKMQIEISQPTTSRGLCTTCLQPMFGCYCAQIHKFDPKIKFVILIHPIEVRRRIATGRMSHLCLKNSNLIMGQDYTHNSQLNDLLNNPNYSPVILYPGASSINITDTSLEARETVFQTNKIPTVIVIDGTWPTAKKMMFKSKNLSHLPRICFTPPGQSRFRVRKQPQPHCYSTIEAIHHTIELLGPTCQFNTNSREHDALLKVFDFMVEKQIQLLQNAFDNPRPHSYRKLKVRIA